MENEIRNRELAKEKRVSIARGREDLLLKDSRSSERAERVINLRLHIEVIIRELESEGGYGTHQEPLLEYERH